MLLGILFSIGIFLLTLLYYIAKIKRFKFDIDEWLHGVAHGKENAIMQKTFFSLYSCAPILSFSLGTALCIVYYYLHTTYSFTWSMVYIIGMIIGLAIVGSACLRKYPTKYVDKHTNGAVDIRVCGSRLMVQLVPAAMLRLYAKELSREELEELLYSDNN